MSFPIFFHKKLLTKILVKLRKKSFAFFFCATTREKHGAGNCLRHNILHNISVTRWQVYLFNISPFKRMLILPTISVTRWQDYLLNISPFKTKQYFAYFQCDQMARLLLNIWPFTTMLILPTVSVTRWQVYLFNIWPYYNNSNFCLLSV